MSAVLVGVSAVMVGLLALGLFAVWRGPTVFDRMISLAQASAVTLTLLVLLGFIAEQPAPFLDVALVYALLAVVLPVALSVYVERSGRTEGRGPDDPHSGSVDAPGGPPR